jgi:hypothetical protein
VTAVFCRLLTRPKRKSSNSTSFVRCIASDLDEASRREKAKSSAYRVYVHPASQAMRSIRQSKGHIARLANIGLVGAPCGRWPGACRWYGNPTSPRPLIAEASAGRWCGNRVQRRAIWNERSAP